MERTTRFLIVCIVATLVAFGVACGPGPSEDDDILVVPEDTAEADTGVPSTDAGDTGTVEDTGSSTMDTGSDSDTGSSEDSGPGADATSDAGPDGDTGGDTSNSPSAEEVDPNCVDGMYSEMLPDPNADISSEKAGYDSNQVKSFIDSVLDKRYPVGRWIVSKGLQNSDRIDCVDRFLRDTSSASAVLTSLSTVVHECGHIFDQAVGGFGSSTYKITPDVSFQCSGGDTTDRNGNTFARSRIKDDQYQNEHPPCGGSRGRDCDSYADIYLDGDPDNNDFEGGDQGFNSLLEETLQYVNSLATAYAFHDEYGRRSTSAMDGILTFLWYTERYLRMARQDYPNAYSHLTGSSCWRKAVLTIWGRAWLMIEAAESHDNLGINEQKLLGLVRTPELLEEIDRVRQKHGCGN